MDKIVTFEEFNDDVMENIKFAPKTWRKGQAVFNYIDAAYGIAREVQFVDNVDCFYCDDEIEHFIRAAYYRYFTTNNGKEA